MTAENDGAGGLEMFEKDLTQKVGARPKIMLKEKKDDNEDPVEYVNEYGRGHISDNPTDEEDRWASEAIE